METKTVKKSVLKSEYQRVELSVIGALLIVCLLAIYLAPQVNSEMSAAEQKSAVELDPKTASSDLNLAESMLYQWWGPFEAPNGKEYLRFFDSIFARDARLSMGAIELDGRDAIKASFAERPPNGGISHHVKGVEVTPVGDGMFQIDADFVYQARALDGQVQAGHSSYRHIVEKQPDGTFLFKKLTADLGEPVAGLDFKESHTLHRAQGAIVQYLGVTDILDSDYARLSDVLADGATVHGMFDPEKETFNDRGDGTLKGRDEIAYWLASRKKNYEWVAHQLTAIEVTALGENRFEAMTMMDVQAQPREGDKIVVSLPIKLMLEDTGGRFMKITRIDR